MLLLQFTLTSDDDGNVEYKPDEHPSVRKVAVTLGSKQRVSSLKLKVCGKPGINMIDIPTQIWPMWYLFTSILQSKYARDSNNMHVVCI